MPSSPPALEPYVENDEGRLARLNCGNGLGGIGGLTGGVPLVLEHTRDQHADVGLIVDDQNVMRHE